ncbi:MaoC family dehydratase N-terminal domain-containing protein [Mycobacterium sp. DL440]|uniref:FAS1-like dehydratase domain-containing protein n=1 Tax=Mycobacterium sp. DL440 TaxID=2675523 RepID=UPI00142489F4|nr:MaoC family dehydratase N-terminal domain-containing protein [Mycobacterium sp. DL440]
MAVTEELVDKVRACVGDASETSTATIDALMSQRYARAIGETNPLYVDVEYARSKGYANVLVPPNFLPSYLDWSDGGAENELRPDGTPPGEMEWVPLEGVRLMGGGEEMIFHSPLVAGTEVVMHSVLDSAESRESKSGPMLILHIRNSYVTSDGAPILTSIRTVLGR